MMRGATDICLAVPHWLVVVVVVVVVGLLCHNYCQLSADLSVTSEDGRTAPLLSSTYKHKLD